MDNVLIFSEDGLTVIDCDKTYSGEIVIPEGVEHIAEHTFEYCKAISIRIPNSVTSIGDMAFFECSSLTSVHISDIVAWCKIVFDMGSSNPLSYAQHLYLGEVEITDLVIPNSVTSIGNCAFCGCSRLTSVTIPSSVTSIGDYAFSGCSRLTSVTIPSSVTSIGNWAFSDCIAMTTVNIPNSVTSIGSSAFSKCSSLSSVNIPNSVTSIGAGAFYQCSRLISVTIPSSVTSIGEYAFADCNGMTSIIIPGSVTSIGNSAFSGCSGLTSITIPSSVTSIGFSAFSCCTGLTSITIYNNVTDIGDSLFANCYKLKEIIIPKGTRKKFEEMLPYQKDKLVEQEQYPQESTKTRKLFLFFDTETTGLPSDWDAPSSDVTNWPRIVQISWIISNDRGQIISKHNYIVKPEGFSIPPELAKVHGITTERALEEGEKLNNILDHFLRDIQQVSFIVGHNISFDKNVVAAEIYRKGNEKHLDENCIDKYVDMLETKPTICTMLSSTNYCRIPRYDNGYKWPKLSELYYKLFNKELVDAHDSSVDVQATFDCFWRLKELGIIGNIDIEDNVIQENEQCVHINKIRFTTFLFNSSVFSGYGGSTSDFSKRLITYEWKLYVSNEKPQDLMFCYPQTLHVMDNGRGINGTYSLKDKNSLLLSMDGESLYLHCVYYNEEIIIFQFDQSNEHLLLYQKHLVFSSVNDIHNYLDRVKQYVDTQRGNARKKKEIELKERADSLIRDIKKRDIEISDKTVESLKSKMKQLCSIVGPEEANKYQPIIDKAIKENENRKRIAAEEKRVNEEERKRKRAKLVRKGSIRLVIILYAVLWITARYYHFSHEWETCGLVLLWSSIILFFLVIATILSFKDIILPNRVKVIHIFFGIITIICSCIYMYDWSKYQKCFNDKVFNPFVSKYYYADNDDNPILDYHNFSVIRGDIYLNETAFHLFDKPVKKIIFEQINHSEDLYFINNYIYKNKSGYYLQEAKRILYNTTDQLCRKAKTLGDWKYIISYAPEEYLSDAKEEYEHLDSIVWNDEELAYQNAKSLNTIEAYDKFMVLYGKGKYCHEISTLLSNLKSNGAKRNNAH